MSQVSNGSDAGSTASLNTTYFQADPKKEPISAIMEEDDDDYCFAVHTDEDHEVNAIKDKIQVLLDSGASVHVAPPSVFRAKCLATESSGDLHSVTGQKIERLGEQDVKMILGNNSLLALSPAVWTTCTMTTYET